MLTMSLFTKFAKKLPSMKIKAPGLSAPSTPSLKKIPTQISAKVPTPNIAKKFAKGTAVVGGTALALTYGGLGAYEYKKNIDAGVETQEKMLDNLQGFYESTGYIPTPYTDGTGGSGFDGTSGSLGGSSKGGIPLLALLGLGLGGVYVFSKRKKKKQ